MPVSFLDLAPKPPTAMLTIDTEGGPQEIEFKGISLRDLASLAQRFPAFAKLLDGSVGSVIEDPPALTALIAASLGHCNDFKVEDHVTSFPSADIIRMGLAVVRLTFPPPQDTVDPLLVSGPAVNGAGVAALDRTSPSQLNN